MIFKKGMIVKKHQQLFQSMGKFVLVGNKINLMELPIGAWTYVYIDYLKKIKIKNNNSKFQKW